MTGATVAGTITIAVVIVMSIATLLLLQRHVLKNSEKF